MSQVQKPTFKEKYDNFINGEFVAPVKGEYFDNVSPVDGKIFTKAARSSEEDVNLALDAAHAAFPTWSTTSATERSNMLLKIAQVMEDNFEYLATLETIDNGKPIREARAADIPYCIDHFRYFAGVIRADEGTISEHDKDTVSIALHEPVGVVGEIIPWNFPLLMLAWKVAPALAAGCTAVVKPAEQTPTSVMCFMELIKDVLPKGVLNIVTGFGAEAGEALATSKRVAKLSFTGSTETGRKVMHNAAENIIPLTLELGGKSPNVFFSSVADQDDNFFDKAIEGALMFALNQGEICTSPSRILVQEDIADKFIEKMQERLAAVKTGHPLDPETMIGSQVSKAQFEKIMNYIKIGREEGAEVLAGGEAGNYEGEIKDGYYIQPTVLKGKNDMRVFQEEIFGPVVSLTTFKTVEEAIELANDTAYGLGAGVWSRDAHELYQVPRAIQAGRVWVNQYHTYPAHAPFGGVKESGFGRENHKMALDHYRVVKNMLISYSKDAVGLF
ncbi:MULTISPECIES: aldehyde dehydrogenase family protein [Mesonia]|uniref:Long-chain-aldehyde dehydrogenase n=1 Tax=Mesonia oceanica TaxID=2687242 RepID=A0AC61Y6H9_9FLAO|nr:MULTISPECIES: aldehyde dehydrogenase family protein [Mesonia]MAN27339.1 aldehyde dehydrogenase [Mesonia sp.]MAQ42268.1 aldehyde dehydrogenase [Mesonia sp.]MBJ98554.1 aldehyde dehydrogenase [Flavobacteriaceae bacterium]VVV00030.1 Long-chain-aldehyde dehydrogenase [Mesonia oceanica]|tara:strand:- start:1464 stop:2966 length:1503 start_codon:yes stop_codon:yes gene_type:complete